MDIKTLIEHIRASGMTYAQISRATGIPQPRLSRWAAGKAPDAATDGIKLDKLAKRRRK